MRKSFLAISIIYGIILVSLFYWQICADLKNHPANPRYYQVFQVQRGKIYDRKGQVLAESNAEGETYLRRYSTPSLSHVLGYFHQRYGIIGLERLYHQDLNSGRSLITTLDLDLQKLAEESLKDKVGALVAIKPTTGEVLALVSSPGVDPNCLDANWSNYLNDPRSPFLNRATHGLYPPGSTVKPLLYGVALREGLVTDDQIWEDCGFLELGNRLIHNSGKKSHGNITTKEALALSSNVVFAQIANLLGSSLLGEYENFGLGAKVEFELSNLAGHLPSKVASVYDAAQLGLGQGELLVTPLQMALAGAAIAAGGTLMRPYIVAEVRGGLKMRQLTRPVVLSRVLPEAVALAVQKAMVLAGSEGTAKTSWSPSLQYGGKTGTAQVSEGKDHAWFIGYAPASSPAVAVAVLVEHGGSGGQMAAPIGVKLMATALEKDE